MSEAPYKNTYQAMRLIGKISVHFWHLNIPVIEVDRVDLVDEVYPTFGFTKIALQG